MRKRVRPEPDSDGEFLWLVSLSDLMILLFVFFVVLFSFSYSKLTSQDLDRIARKFSTNEQSAASGHPLDEIQKKILKWVVDRRLLDSVEVSQKQDAVILQIKEHVLFDRGKFELKPEADDIMTGMGRALEWIPPPYRIGIEGHADQTPVRPTSRLKDNWELSTKRALSVLRALDLKKDLEQRTVIMGYGAMKPVSETDHLNRRVAIRIF